jgi:hypothetical protein
LTILIFGKFISLVIERPLKEGFDFEGVVFFSQSEDHPFAFLVADDQSDRLIVSEYAFDLAEGFEVGDELIGYVQDLNEVFVGALFVLLVLLLKGNYDEVVRPELFDDPLLTLYEMCFYFLAGYVLIQILRVTFERYYYMAIPHHFHEFDLALHDPLFLSHVLNPKKVFFIRIVNVCLVKPSSQLYEFDLFLVKDFIGQFVVVLE